MAALHVFLFRECNNGRLRLLVAILLLFSRSFVRVFVKTSIMVSRLLELNVVYRYGINSDELLLYHYFSDTCPMHALHIALLASGYLMFHVPVEIFSLPLNFLILHQ